jgi:hypothetical protein
MMSEVLRDHPRSAKAHYVTAELYAEQRNSAMGRRELAIAQQLDPSLSFATPASVSELERKLSRAPSMQARSGDVQPRSFPWGVLAIVVVGAGLLLWVVLRGRRTPSSVYSQIPAPSPPVPPAAPVAGAPIAPGSAGVAPSVGAGIGTGVVGGLASGLGAGVGIVAGEELARHFLDPGRREDTTPVASDPVIVPRDDDLGGQNFGVSDGSSWDDNAQAPDSSSGIDDDWT